MRRLPATKFRSVFASLLPGDRRFRTFSAKGGELSASHRPAILAASPARSARSTKVGDQQEPAIGNSQKDELRWS